MFARAVQAFPARRIAGGLAVLALHLLAILALISVTHYRLSVEQQPREIILRLLAPPTPKLETPTPAPEAAKKKIVPRSSVIMLPPALTRPLAVPPGGATLEGLRRGLFDCALSNQLNLTLEERAQCAAASNGPRFDPNGTDYRDHTGRSRDAALWARDRARKNAPGLLPCMSPAGFSPLYTLACLGKSAVEGRIDPESQPGYQDMPDHETNEGDTRMAPVPH